MLHLKTVLDSTSRHAILEESSTASLKNNKNFLLS